MQQPRIQADEDPRTFNTAHHTQLAELITHGAPDAAMKFNKVSKYNIKLLRKMAKLGYNTENSQIPASGVDGADELVVNFIGALGTISPLITVSGSSKTYKTIRIPKVLFEIKKAPAPSAARIFMRLINFIWYSSFKGIRMMPKFIKAAFIWAKGIVGNVNARESLSYNDYIAVFNALQNQHPNLIYAFLAYCEQKDADKETKILYRYELEAFKEKISAALATSSVREVVAAFVLAINAFDTAQNIQHPNNLTIQALMIPTRPDARKLDLRRTGGKKGTIKRTMGAYAAEQINPINPLLNPVHYAQLGADITHLPQAVYRVPENRSEFVARLAAEAEERKAREIAAEAEIEAQLNPEVKKEEMKE